MTTPTLEPAVDVRRAADRYRTRMPWLDSHHSFAFGPHYDPANTHHGLLMVNNDDVVAPGTGFDTHPHRDMEIVTWVLRGSLVHQDSTGHAGVIYPGLAQRMSAGTGILHSEKNDFVGHRADGALASSRAGRRQGDRHVDPVHFVQMWVVPDEAGGEPGYAQAEIDADLLSGELVPVVSGPRGHGAIPIANRHATLHAARLQPGGSVTLPEAPYLHLFVARGTVALEGAGELAAGDAVRFTATGGQRVSCDRSGHDASTPHSVRGGRPAPDSGAEILVWEMHATVAA
jgi:redox-sensitive bicupin YhaK (pirin superfamily)